MSPTDWTGYVIALAIVLLIGWLLHRITDKAPEWANWIAQDANGSWWYFEYEPSAIGCWWWSDVDGKFELVRKDAHNPNWRSTLAMVRRQD